MAQRVGVILLAVGEFPHAVVVGGDGFLVFQIVNQHLVGGDDGFVDLCLGGLEQGLFIGGAQFLQPVDLFLKHGVKGGGAGFAFCDGPQVALHPLDDKAGQDDAGLFAQAQPLL